MFQLVNTLVMLLMTRNLRDSRRRRNGSKSNSKNSTYSKTLRIQPRKARLVLNLIRGKDVEEAAAICKFTPNKGGYLVGKVLKSAVSNAVNNNDLDESKLYVKACWADEGITMKRYMPRAKGSASPINKRTSHITVVVAEKE